MRKLGRREWILLLFFLVTLTVTGLFAARAFRRAAYWHEHRDETIRPWMSVGYVAHSYRVPPPVLYQAIGLEPTPRDRRPLREIAAQQHRSVDILISELQHAIIEFRRSHQAPGGPPSLNGGASP
jgi:hypothetical protein